MTNQINRISKYFLKQKWKKANTIFYMLDTCNKMDMISEIMTKISKIEKYIIV